MCMTMVFNMFQKRYTCTSISGAYLLCFVFGIFIFADFNLHFYQSEAMKIKRETKKDLIIVSAFINCVLRNVPKSSPLPLGGQYST